MRISRRRFIQTAAAGAAGLALGGYSSGGEAQAPRPNVLYIMTDQQRWDTIGASGNSLIRTPNLDRLAAGGANFTRFYTAAFPCSPSRATLITGRHPHSHGVWTNDTLLDPSVRTLGEVSRDAGYDTAWIGKWHLGGDMYGGNWAYRYTVGDGGLQREKVDLQHTLGEDAPQHGLEHWVGGFTQYQDYLRQHDLLEPRPGKKIRGNHHTVHEDGHSVIPEEHFMTAFLAKEAIKFLESPERSQRPFTCCLSFHGPHLPITPPEPWDQMYDRAAVPLPGNLNDDLRTKPWRNQRNNRHWMREQWSDDQYRDIIARYWGYCSYIDQWTGRVLDTLEARGLADNTVVVFTSDHGEMIGSHGFIYKGSYMYDGVQRVPFIMRAPGRIPAGMQTDALGSSVDLLPTLTEMMGVEAPPETQGRSMLPLLSGQAHAGRDATFTQINGPTLGIAMVRTDRHKFAYNWKQRQVDELYDMENDPLELENLALDPGHAQTVSEMQDRVFEWMQEHDHPLLPHATAALAQQPEMPLDVRPEVTVCELTEGNRLRFAYQWHCGDSVEAGTRGFVQFIHPEFGEEGCGDISFRIVSWPETPTEQWKPGEVYPMPMDEVSIPEWAGSGTYDVRAGLYNPETREGPALIDGSGNYVVVGTLTIERDGDEVTGARFTAAR
ncbi:MAG: sulfatase-like hydrolase/transferase [Armatimonadota bacterium]